MSRRGDRKYTFHRTKVHNTDIVREEGEIVAGYYYNIVLGLLLLHLRKIFENLSVMFLYEDSGIVSLCFALIAVPTSHYCTCVNSL